MGWGGARPGAGRPAAPDSKRTPKPKQPKAPKAAATVPAEPKKRPGVDLGAIASIIELSAKTARAQAKRPEFNPYKLPAFPPAAVPPKANQMAMDQVPATQWASGEWAAAVFNNAAAEGLLFLGYPYLSELAQRPEYRVISETIADDATRKWIDFEVVGDQTGKADNSDQEAAGGALDKAPDGQEPPSNKDLARKAEEDRERRADGIAKSGKSDKVKQLRDEMERLLVRDHFYAVCRDDGFFGRSHMFMDFGNNTPAELKTPIGNGRDGQSKAKVGKGALKRLQVIEPVWVYPTTYNATNPLSENWYNPEVWYVLGQEIHRSRIPAFVSRPVPDMLKPAYAFGGIALSQLAKPYVDIWLTTRESVGALIHAFSVMVLSTDMAAMLAPGAAGSGAADLLARASLFNALRDNQGLFLINKETEDFKNVSAALSGLHELQAQSQEHMSSVSRIPLVKLTGISPSGLNASSEGEIRAYYDTIAGYQNRFLRPRLTPLVDFMQLSLWGELDPEIGYVFEPLWEMSEKEIAELQKHEGERDQIYVDVGAISPEEVRGRIIDDPKLPYGDLDPDDVPEPPQQPTGEDPFGGGGPGGPLPDRKEPGAEDHAVVPFDGAADDWDESKHPRGKGGKFASTPGGGGGLSDEQKQAAIKSGKAQTLDAIAKAMGFGGWTGALTEEQKAKVIAKQDEQYAAAAGPKSNFEQVNDLAKQWIDQTHGGEASALQSAEAKLQVVGEGNAAGLNASDAFAALTDEEKAALAEEHGSLQKAMMEAFGAEAAQAAMGKEWTDTTGTLSPEEIEATPLDDDDDDPADKGAVQIAEAEKQLAGAKQKKTAFGGLWKVGVGAPGSKEEFAHNLNHVLSKATNAGSTYRTMLGHFLKNADKMGYGDKKDAIKAKLAEAFVLAADKAKAAMAGTTDHAEKIKFDKLATAAQAKAKEYGWKAGGTEQQQANSAKAAKATLEKYTPGFAKVLGMLHKTGDPLKDAENIVIAASANDGTWEAAEMALTPEQQGALKAQHGSIEKAYSSLKGHKIHPPTGAKSKTPKTPQLPPATEVPKNFPKPTAEELTKAKKSVALQPQFVPGVSDLKTGVGAQKALALTEEFNEKWQGKENLLESQLTDKVNDFKGIVAKVEQLKAEEATHAAEWAKKEKAQQAEANKKAAAALKAQQEAAAAKNAEYKQALGITETEATGFDALAQMIGGSSKDLVAQFKNYEAEAKGYGYPMSGFQAALIKNYTNGGYSSVNKAMRSGSWSASQHVYAKLVNDALDKMPKFSGQLQRGAHLSAEQIARYKAGNVVVEHAFTSTGDDFSFGGNVKYTITATGKRAAKIQKLSYYGNEKEVLFKANTFFLVHKVETKGGVTHIHMEEVDSYG